MNGQEKMTEPFHIRYEVPQKIMNCINYELRHKDKINKQWLMWQAFWDLFGRSWTKPWT